MNSNHLQIHSIETFGTVDGPGIRFVLFLQGCNLQCKYCHNRDTWALNEGTATYIEEIIAHIKKNENYINASGGGVTITGGEPLLQVKALLVLVKELKKLNFHVAIDTSGSLSLTEDIKELINLVDLFLLDIKHIDNKKCIELTGFSNKNTLHFAEFLSNNNKHMWIRYVLVPTITDNKNDLINLSHFIKSLKTVDKIEILAYHSMGKFKWNTIGCKYPLEGIPDATDEDVKKAESLLY